MSKARTLNYPIPPRTVKTRRIEFKYPADELPKHFMSGDLVMSHVLAVLSSYFPEGEEFFVRSVRNYRDQITDPELKKQVAGFIGQESIHGREHKELNDRLDDMGYPTKAIDRGIKLGLGFLEKVTPKSRRLGVTAALEHYTATLAEIVLTDPNAREMFGTPEVQNMFIWHALEESEHKSVAFDVFQTVNGKNFVRRGTFIGTTVIFIGLTVALTAVSLLMDPAARWHPINLVRSLARLRHSPFANMKVARYLWAYMNRDFHPDQQDNAELTEYWRNELFGESGRLAERYKVADRAGVA